MAQVKVSISPSQQWDNPCILGNGCTEQKHMFGVGEELFALFKADWRFDPYLVPMLDKLPLNEYLNKICALTEAFQGKDGLRVSLHSDGGYNGSGCSVFYYANGYFGDKAGHAVYNRVSALTPWNDMKCYPRPGLAEIRIPTCTCILVEVSFHDNQVQALWIHEQKKALANSIYLGVLDSYGFKELVKPKPTPIVIVDKELEAAVADLCAAKDIGDPAYWLGSIKAGSRIVPEYFVKLVKNVAGMQCLPDSLTILQQKGATSQPEKWNEMIEKNALEASDVRWMLIQMAKIN